ncbi:MAG: hypothetical protein ABJZ55_07575 [Fuerstiella sp.]
MHRAALVGLIVLTGCQHAHLRHNTVHQAQTLSDVYEQQVLDNLARTVHDAHAIPSFAYPKEGTTSITDKGGFSASPLKNFSNVLGIDGSRSGLEQWGLTPVSDPDKLQLMQCAYQRAVYGGPLDACAECCEKENKFEGRTDTKLKVAHPCQAGLQAIKKPGGGGYYLVMTETKEYINDTNERFPIDKDGYVTLLTADCNGPCSITCGWLKHGSRCDLPRDCCGLVGFHRGTYVWVDKCYRQHLSRLTLKILDYAINDAPATVSRQKKVRLKVDKFGRLTAKDKDAVGTVTATIGIKDPISSVLVIDHCAVSGLTDNLEQTADVRREEVTKSLQTGVQKLMENKSLLEDRGALELNLVDLLVEEAEKQTTAAIQAVSPIPTEPSKLVIPKRRTVRPSDYGVNPYQIQRSQRGLGIE